MSLPTSIEPLPSSVTEPTTGDFLQGALTEAAYQREAWAHTDPHKADADWMWLIGWLVGKAVHAESAEKKLHNIESAAAALANWHHKIKETI